MDVIVEKRGPLKSRKAPEQGPWSPKRYTGKAQAAYWYNYSGNESGPVWWG